MNSFCSDEQKSLKKNLVKFGARYVSLYVARAPAVNIVKESLSTTVLCGLLVLFSPRIQSIAHRSYAASLSFLDNVL